MRSLLIIVLFFLPAALAAQFTYTFDQSIPVKNIEGDELSMPWAGGINAAQYNTLDLNSDGKQDLVLFDRMANKVLTYLNVENQYRYTPEYEALFPDGVTNWILLRDYNCDGKKDIFTGDNLGIKVYTNKTIPGENLEWDQFFFFTQPGENKSPVLLTKGFSGKINLQLQFDDLPNIADVDGDGDLDIMNVRFVGAGTIEYHQNFSMERYGTCDSLDFERQTQQWGGLTECGCGVYAYNGAPCNSPGGGRVEHAGGKALLTMDVNNDGVLDLLFSEASCAQIHQFINEGTNTNPVFNSASTFPTTDPVNLLIFPAAYYEDVDFDGVPDLLATPNIFKKDYPSSKLDNSNWFYKNTGTTQNPSFSLTQTNFLQDQMIDVGDNAVPTFADVDGDGDFDMFIGQFETGFQASIHLYENIGTVESPSFQLVTKDYLNLSLYNFNNIKPQFVDINSDGKIDLVFTKKIPQINNTQGEFFFLLNKSQTGLDFSGQPITNIPITFSFQENIHITDVNKDGIPDLLIGRSTGALEYWKNTGVLGSFNFVLEDAAYLNFGPSVLRQFPACFTSDLDNDGKMDLLISNQLNTLSILSDYRESDSDATVSEIIFNPITGTYQKKNLGGRIWPTAVHLFRSEKPVIVVGNTLGGLHLLMNENSDPLPATPQVTVYPVPLPKNEKLKIRSDRPGYLQILSTLGQEVTPFYIVPANQEVSINLPPLASGLYLARMIFGKSTVTKRIVISE